MCKIASLLTLELTMISCFFDDVRFLLVLREIATATSFIAFRCVALLRELSKMIVAAVPASLIRHSELL